MAADESQTDVKMDKIWVQSESHKPSIRILRSMGPALFPAFPSQYTLSDHRMVRHSVAFRSAFPSRAGWDIIAGTQLPMKIFYFYLNPLTGECSDE